MKYLNEIILFKERNGSKLGFEPKNVNNKKINVGKTIDYPC